MKNVTITLDEAVARWARIRAAEQETSVSRFVGELLRRNMVEEDSYHVGMQSYLSQTPRPLRKSRRPYPRRQELYDRRSLR
ncbi:MAG: hypothetical protein V3U07_01170 [Nitrospirales bacterium]|jgi:hypothetical protein